MVEKVVDAQTKRDKRIVRHVLSGFVIIYICAWLVAFGLLKQSQGDGDSSMSNSGIQSLERQEFTNYRPASCLIISLFLGHKT